MVAIGADRSERPRPAQPFARFECMVGQNSLSRSPFALEMRLTGFPAVQHLLHLEKDWQFGAHEPRL